jgi:glycogen debranching enzyme
LVGMAWLESSLGDPGVAPDLHRRATRLRDAFNETFWRPQPGLLAMALDGAGRPLEVASSNMGHALWSGIVDESIAGLAVQRLMQPDLLTPWGIRTLGSNERGYNPMGYHLGTVWAHDCSFIVAGLARRGFTEEVRVLTSGLLRAAESFGWRLPELFGGIDTSIGSDQPDRAAPLPYPASCSPQAWAAGAPLLLLRAVAGLEPDVPAQRIGLRSALDDGEWLGVDGVVIDGKAHRLELSGSRAELSPQ